MPCSCGNTICPCGIPCYCSEESCKCLDCAIALSRFCKICNKPLITERPINEGMCSCFVGESIAFILENRDNPKRRLGNIPMPLGYFVPGKLVVNVMIPIPIMSFPHFIPQQPFFLMPPVPAKEADDSKISFISDEDVLKPVYPPEHSDFHSTAELNQFLAKSNVESGDYDSSGYSSNCEQNEVTCQKLCPPSEFFQIADNRQTLNIVHNTKSETEDQANIQEITSFYLPSVMINNISYPVGMIDPIWRLPNPAVCIAGSPQSTLKLFNPFYVAGLVHTTQTVATCESDFIPPAPAPTVFPENKYRNVQAESDISLQMKEQTLDQTKASEQSNLLVNGGNVEFAVPSNNTTGNECTALPYLGDSNAIALSEQCEISANCLMPDQSQSFTPGKNYSFQACPDICNPTNQISDDVYPESTCEPLQKVEWTEIPVLTNSIPQVLSGNSGTSKLQMLCERCQFPSSEKNEFSQKGNSRFVFADKENLPLYIDTCTTQKMEKLLKSTQKLDVSSPTLAGKT